MCPLSGNSTLSNKFKVLHDKEKMDNCNGYFEVKEKEENVASGNVAHDFDSVSYTHLTLPTIYSV